MWIINKLHTTSGPNGGLRRGWHCILAGSAHEEWVDEGYEGYVALQDWMDSPEVREMSLDFCIAAQYDLEPMEYRIVKLGTDRQN